MPDVSDTKPDAPAHTHAVEDQQLQEVGRSERFEFPVERGKILEFARAIRSNNAAFRGAAAVAPPTFLIVAGQIWGYSWEHPGDSPLATMHVDPAQELHLEETYEYYDGPLRAGTALQGELRLFAPVEKVGRRSGRMSIITTETTFWFEDGRKAALARQVIAKLHDAHRDHDASETGDRAVAPQPQATDKNRAIGDSTRRYGPLTMEDVVQYQAASGDLNPHHYDPAILAAAGFQRFFVPGMLEASLLSSQVVDTYGAESVRRISVRFRELVYVGDVITCTMSRLPTPSNEETGLREVELSCIRGDGQLALTGTALVATS